MECSIRSLVGTARGFRSYYDKKLTLKRQVVILVYESMASSSLASPAMMI